jgi:hypothetical protein
MSETPTPTPSTPNTTPTPSTPNTIVVETQSVEVTPAPLKYVYIGGPSK